MPSLLRFTCLALLSACLLLQQQAVAADDEQTTRRQLSKLGSEIKKLRQLSQQFSNERDELQSALRTTETRIGTLNRQLRHSSNKLKTQQQQIKQLQQQRQQLQQLRQQQQQLIEQQIRAAFRQGRESKLKLLLNQQDPQQLSRQLAYYDHFNQARSEQIDRYMSIIDQLNSTETAITETREKLQQSKLELEQQRRALVDENRQRQRSLAQIQRSLNSNQQRQQQLSSDRKHLEELLQAMVESIANLKIPDQQPFKSRRGKLLWPVKGKLRQSFGQPRNDSKQRWQGVILAAKEGSDVQAIHRGRVLFADWLRGSGLLVILDHGDGYMSLYAHNQSLLIEPGEWIEAGDTIATVGNSGGRKEAGLYFEIRHRGEPSNPQRWCKRA